MGWPGSDDDDDYEEEVPICRLPSRMMEHAMVKNHSLYWKYLNSQSLNVEVLTGDHLQSFLDLNAWRAHHATLSEEKRFVSVHKS
ncbi:hypothetical protein ZWY2020_029279 [Hordeum vulgare]|nr:hypothetical protein ZWY2020_029279 [Hordeum vulgare]